jgi:hypothetical protein
MAEVPKAFRFDNEAAAAGDTPYVYPIILAIATVPRVKLPIIVAVSGYEVHVLCKDMSPPTSP